MATKKTVRLRRMNECRTSAVLEIGSAFSVLNIDISDTHVILKSGGALALDAVNTGLDSVSGLRSGCQFENWRCPAAVQKLCDMAAELSEDSEYAAHVWV